MQIFTPSSSRVHANSKTQEADPIFVEMVCISQLFEPSNLQVTQQMCSIREMTLSPTTRMPRLPQSVPLRFAYPAGVSVSLSVQIPARGEQSRAEPMSHLIVRWPRALPGIFKYFYDILLG